jgi:hypothetical protein
MHDAPHAQPVTQQSPSVVVPPGQVERGGCADGVLGTGAT